MSQISLLAHTPFPSTPMVPVWDDMLSPLVKERPSYLSFPVYLDIVLLPAFPLSSILLDVGFSGHTAIRSVQCKLISSEIVHAGFTVMLSKPFS